MTLNDDRPVNEEASTANFLIPFDCNEFGGISVAELCSESLKNFNPMVRVSVEKGLLLLYLVLLSRSQSTLTNSTLDGLHLEPSATNCLSHASMLSD